MNARSAQSFRRLVGRRIRRRPLTPLLALASVSTLAAAVVRLTIDASAIATPIDFAVVWFLLGSIPLAAVWAVNARRGVFVRLLLVLLATVPVGRMLSEVIVGPSALAADAYAASLALSAIVTAVGAGLLFCRASSAAAPAGSLSRPLLRHSMADWIALMTLVAVASALLARGRGVIVLAIDAAPSLVIEVVLVLWCVAATRLQQKRLGVLIALLPFAALWCVEGVDWKNSVAVVVCAAPKLFWLFGVQSRAVRRPKEHPILASRPTLAAKPALSVTG